ncbi:hypothetical protein EJ04DRAFT_414810, partial [Polyplosphaeria fusca]
KYTMASFPAQRRTTQRATSDAAPAHQDLNRTDSEAFSTTSVDSQTLLLNSSPSITSVPAESVQENTGPQPAERPIQATQTDAEPRKCWICFNDETEDDENTSEWRSPCPCVLVAHEKCLLDWIADMEAPSSRRQAGGSKGKIQCPQCKSEIKLQRPRSLVVSLVRLTEKVTGLLLLPGFVLVVGSAAYSTATLLGSNTIYQIFGTEEAARILEPLYQPPNAHEGGLIVRTLKHLAEHWRLDIGVPLIPTVLVFSRTSLVDPFLYFLPLLFLAPSKGFPELTWPPSAASTITLLPCIRLAYNAYYERIWLPRERRWLKEIQPRVGSEDEVIIDAAEVHDGAGHVHFDDFADDFENADVDEVVQVNVDFDIFADWQNGGEADNHNAPENPPVPIARGPAPPIDAPPLPDHDAEGAPAPQVPQQPARRQRVRRERRAQFSTTSLADTILGALIFPTLAAAVGEALKYTLPKSWVTPPLNGKATGFLQARWGRSILGGCLFVGFKDALLLYVRWRMAKNHRMRRVLDYDKSK